MESCAYVEYVGNDLYNLRTYMGVSFFAYMMFGLAAGEDCSKVSVYLVLVAGAPLWPIALCGVLLGVVDKRFVWELTAPWGEEAKLRKLERKRAMIQLLENVEREEMRVKEEMNRILHL